MPTKSFFGGLKAIDAFGKVCLAGHADSLVQTPMLTHHVDHGGRQGQNTHGGIL